VCVRERERERRRSGVDEGRRSRSSRERCPVNSDFASFSLFFDLSFSLFLCFPPNALTACPTKKTSETC
jgi:hypothetical protein